MARLPPLQGTAFLYLPPSPFIFSSLQPYSDFLPFEKAMPVLVLLIQLTAEDWALTFKPWLEANQDVEHRLRQFSAVIWPFPCQYIECLRLEW